jgi:hypothetical protein
MANLKHTLVIMTVLYSSQSTANSELLDALLCQGNPLETLRAYSQLGVDQYDSGVVGVQWGENWDHRDVVVLRDGLKLEGSTANTIIGELEFNPYHGFPGLIYALFEGNAQSLIQRLDLQESMDPETDDQLYSKPTHSLEENDLCPRTIYLKLLGPDRFVLGCGWCNG